MKPAALLPVSARRRLGQEARRRAPLESITRWTAASDRPDPISLLESQAKTRIQALVPLRYGRMLESPQAFLRGAALVMAQDLAGRPTTAIEVQLAGDAHLSNFGLFASPERDLVFDIGDFDETLPGPWEWDVMRLVASVIVAGRSRSFGEPRTEHAAAAASRTYREWMASYAGMRAIDVFYATVDVARIQDFVERRARPFLRSTIRSAAHHDALHDLSKLTEIAHGRRRIVDHPPLVTHPSSMPPPLDEPSIARYRASLLEDRGALLDRYALLDVALKVVGVGSVGLASWVALFQGGDPGDPLLLQVKQAEASVLERFLGPDRHPTHGERVVAGQRRLQATPDVLLGWTVGPGERHLYVRQLHDQKGSAVLEAMTPDDLVAWAELCGWALARGHARSGEPATIAGYLGDDERPDAAFVAFGRRYADQTERDHAALVAAVRAGRVRAEPDA